jgi:hypothetical protein
MNLNLNEFSKAAVQSYYPVNQLVLLMKIYNYMKNLLYVMLVLVAQTALGQQSVKSTVGIAQQNLEDLGRSNNLGMVWSYDDRYEGVKGSPYYSEEWCEATIGYNNKVVDKIVAKYNVYENVIIYRNSEGKIFKLEPNNINSFTLKDSLTQRMLTFKKADNLQAMPANRFVLQVYDGKRVQLILLPEKIKFKADYKASYSSGRKFDEIKDVKTYYFISGLGPHQKVKLTKKSLLQLLADKKNIIEPYLQKENIDAGSEEGWIKVLAYYETL